MTTIKRIGREQIDIAEQFEEFETRTVFNRNGTIIFDILAVESKKTKDMPYQWDVRYVNTN